MAWWMTDGVLTRADAAPAANSIKTDITGEGNAVLPEGVTFIADAAFEACGELTGVMIPEGVTGIGNQAFWDCTKLKDVSLPDSLISIGEQAFAGCRGLKEISLPKGLKSIGKRAFFACSELTKAVIPEDVNMIAEGTFSDCENLESVTLPESLMGIGYMAFRFCRNLRQMVLPAKVSVIGGLAFYDCRSLTDVKLPKGCVFVGRYAFGSGMKAGTIAMLRSMRVVGYAACWNLDVPMIPAEAFGMLREAIADGGALDGVQAIACPILPKEAPAHMRLKLCVGFAVNREKYSEELCAEYIAYIKKNAAKLIEAAFDYPALLRLMCAEKLIAAKDIDKFGAEAAKRGDVELTAAVLNYQASALSAKDVAKARERREKTRERQDDTVVERMAARSGKQGIDGLNFAVTGGLQMFSNRDELKAYIAERGGKLTGTMSAKTDYLITNDTDTGSAKNEKAAELGIEIITENEFVRMTQKTKK